MNNYLSLGERIEDLLKEKKISQRTLAKKINISTSALSNYINNNQTPSADIILKIADELKTSTDYLLGRTRYKYWNEQNIDISNQLALSTEAVNYLKASKLSCENPLEAKTIDLLLGTELGTKALRNIACILFAQNEKFKFSDGNEFKETLEINVDSHVNSFNIYAKEATNVLMLDLFEQLRDLKNESKKIEVSNIKHCVIRNAPIEYLGVSYEHLSRQKK